MKKLNLTILLTMLLSMVGTKAFAHDIEVQNADGVTIYYVWTNYIKTKLAVSYQGTFYDDYSNEYSGDVVIPESVTYNGKTYSVTSIGDWAFEGCSGHHPQQRDIHRHESILALYLETSKQL